MIEQAMYLGIGFLLAGLLGIIFMPLVHARAVRLTIKRIEASLPMSLAEIQAEKDQMRAEFAMTTRRLEMSVEQLQVKVASQSAELGKKADAVNRLRAELDDKVIAFIALEAREKALQDKLHATEEQYAQKTTEAHDIARRLAIKEAEFTRLAEKRGAPSLDTDRQMNFIVARMKIDALELRLKNDERKIAELRALHEKDQHDATASNRKTESRRAVETIEQALLRERIETIAADITRLTLALEGPDSPIHAILKDNPQASGQLAERMRALLQARTTRRASSR
jgi:hypothetical protein